jgi:hypothetical protein
LKSSILDCRQQLEEYSLDHIIPSSRGGKDHPTNYFLMPRHVNNYFGNSWTAEKVAYIGAGAALAAGRHRWPDLELVTCKSPVDSTELLDPVYHLGCRQSNP